MTFYENEHEKDGSSECSSKILFRILRHDVVQINTRLLRSVLEVIGPNERISREGHTALHFASGIKDEKTSLRALRIVSSYSPNPNIPKNDGETSMHVAASLGHKFALDLLMRHGGSLLQCSIDGKSSIEVAHENGHFGVSSYLSSILNFEEYEKEIGEKTKSVLWNRQLLELNPELSVFIPLSGECLLCKQIFIMKDDEEHGSGNRKDSTFSLVSEISQNIISSFESLGSKASLVPDYKSFHDHVINCYIQSTSNPKDESNLKKSSSRDILNEGQGCSFYERYCSEKSFIREESQESTSRLEFTESTSLLSFFSSLTCLSQNPSSFVTLIEERLHTDQERRIDLIERKTVEASLQPAGDCTRFSKDSDVLSESILGLTGEELRIKLKELGFDAGPVTPSTFKVLQRHFYKLRRRSQSKTQGEENEHKTFSRELEQMIRRTNGSSSHYEDLERNMSDPFMSPDNLAFWRSGIQKTSFTYLLLDPRITKSLHLRRNVASDEELFRVFLNAIFYIGKGTRARPFSHLYEAVSTKANSKNEEKVVKIKSIWEEDFGVVSLHVFQNVIPVEAWTREASMISAIGLDNLANCNKGSFYGPASSWCRKDQRLLGSYCLLKAYRIFVLEGERQIKPLDIPPQKWMVR